jgi:hypothetical protein
MPTCVRPFVAYNDVNGFRVKKKKNQITQLAGVVCLFMLASQGCAHKHKAEQPPPAPSGEESAASTPAAATDEAPATPPTSSADAAPAAEPTATAIVETPPAPTAEETPPPPPADATPAEPLVAADAPSEAPKTVTKRKHHKKRTPKEDLQPMSVAQAAAASAAGSPQMTPPPDPNAQMNAMNQAPAPQPVQQKAPLPRKTVVEAPREPAEQKNATDEQPFYMKPTFLGPAALVLAILTGMSIIRRRNNS